ncbi:hypothetical protein SDC9_134390 [bioreactor metagenome]|uniref:Uncharacterized protein n=1 Tax=bioreactor metagenome TaxID=1076179 RepID=A0A645DD27_9ZZZZ
MHQHPAVQRANNRGDQSQRFIDDAHFSGVKAHTTNQKGGGQAHGEGITQLIKDDEQQNQPGVVTTEEIA